MIVGNTILMKPLSDDKINIVFKTYEVTKNDILLLSVYLA